MSHGTLYTLQNVYSAFVMDGMEGRVAGLGSVRSSPQDVLSNQSRKIKMVHTRSPKRATPEGGQKKKPAVKSSSCVPPRTGGTQSLPLSHSHMHRCCAPPLPPRFYKPCTLVSSAGCTYLNQHCGGSDRGPEWNQQVRLWICTSARCQESNTRRDCEGQNESTWPARVRACVTTDCEPAAHHPCGLQSPRAAPRPTSSAAPRLRWRQMLSCFRDIRGAIKRSVWPASRHGNTFPFTEVQAQILQVNHPYAALELSLDVFCDFFFPRVNDPEKPSTETGLISPRHPVTVRLLIPPCGSEGSFPQLENPNAHQSRNIPR